MAYRRPCQTRERRRPAGSRRRGSSRGSKTRSTRARPPAAPACRPSAAATSPAAATSLVAAATRPATIVAATGSSSDLAWPRRCRPLAGSRWGPAALQRSLLLSEGPGASGAADFGKLLQCTRINIRPTKEEPQNSATILQIKNDDRRKRGPEIPDTRGTRPERNKDPESHTPIHPVESCFGSDASECPDDRNPPPWALPRTWHLRRALGGALTRRSRRRPCPRRRASARRRRRWGRSPPSAGTSRWRRRWRT